jgi:hypothetical protein
MCYRLADYGRRRTFCFPALRRESGPDIPCSCCPATLVLFRCVGCFAGCKKRFAVGGPFATAQILDRCRGHLPSAAHQQRRLTAGLASTFAIAVPVGLTCAVVAQFVAADCFAALDSARARPRLPKRQSRVIHRWCQARSPLALKSEVCFGAGVSLGR